MSWSYTGDPTSSDLDALRFLVSDTDEDSPVFTNEELEYLIDNYGENQTALEYQVFRQAATKFARSIKRSLGPQSEDPSTRLSYYKERAAAAKAKLSAKGIYVPKYQAPKQFRKGMMDNPPAPMAGRYV